MLKLHKSQFNTDEKGTTHTLPYNKIHTIMLVTISNYHTEPQVQQFIDSYSDSDRTLYTATISDNNKLFLMFTDIACNISGSPRHIQVSFFAFTSVHTTNVCSWITLDMVVDVT